MSHMFYMEVQNKVVPEIHSKISHVGLARPNHGLV